MNRSEYLQELLLAAQRSLLAGRPKERRLRLVGAELRAEPAPCAEVVVFRRRPAVGSAHKGGTQ